ncbi:MAG TPA: VOC family protein [Chthoniobacterales bacterium]|jgi:hypothetical protein|nr:VOC family protein [Chthoniobacterales bacterium]
MNTEIIVHPKLMHYGLATANLDAMIDWYRKVLGMTVNNRLAIPAGAENRPPFRRRVHSKKAVQSTRTVLNLISWLAPVGRFKGSNCICAAGIANVYLGAKYC